LSEQLHKIPMQKSLTNMLFFVEDLRIVNVKIGEISDLINTEKVKQLEHFKILTTTWELW